MVRYGYKKYELHELQKALKDAGIPVLYLIASDGSLEIETERELTDDEKATVEDILNKLWKLG